MEREDWKIFEELEGLKFRPGETLKTSYFRSGGRHPLFVITEKIDGTATLYRVDGQTLQKVQSADNIKSLEALVLPQLK